MFCDPYLKKLAPSKLEMGTQLSWLVPVPSIWCILIPSDHRKWHSMWQAIIVVFCCLVSPHLHLDWYSHILDWTTSPRAQPHYKQCWSPKEDKVPIECTCIKKWNLQCLHWPSTVCKLITSKKTDTYKLILMFWWYRMLSWTTIPYTCRSEHYPSRLPTDQCHYISNSHSNKKLIRCYKLVSWSLYTKPHLG